MNCRLPAAAAIVGLALFATSCVVPAAPSGGSAKNSGNASPNRDVTISNCTVDSALGLPEAGLKIRNKSRQTSDYAVTVEFTDVNKERVAEGAATVSSLAPGRTAHKEATGDGAAVGQLKCRVVKVDRWPSL